ncbi:class I SAM-dependent methyltransferase [Denitromonas iodatirespirans]|uniref:Class I SAM-dependent methyltransferase n=1 Tax=Denitromonas iodatirespirans TaxID=2795389 RepID=A0A944DER2_DENI1|nr:class I SAM-dependent methyltransferase [Denitromonas iodatirespirans]MBT0963073.1 class I SAM-dependent methyltransferase [Denitromonas iodatirespirans]
MRDLDTYRASEAERLRTDDLLSLMPAGGDTALDVGARDGHFSRLMAERFGQVTALDLSRPDIDHPKVVCVAGNVTALDYPDRHFDLVFCAEVLEHIPSPGLEQACAELARVCRKHLLIGVPFDQDIRVGRTTCSHCGGRNPPWGHVNRFDEARLTGLFPDLRLVQRSLVGSNRERTNALSAWLMDRAGNPYGTYSQDEPCLHCARPVGAPAARSFGQKLLTRAAFIGQRLQRPFVRTRANWIHLRFERGD